MRCLYCDRKIGSYSFRSLFLKDDPLCPDCRKAIKARRRIIEIEGVRIETFFDYDSLFSSLLLQYKECHDEALKDVFLYEISDYLKLRYHGYHLAYVPSSNAKLEERGFDHLRQIFACCKMKEIEGLKMKEELCQEGRNQEERRKMRNNYVYQGPHYKKVLIVDDVLTSGSSLLGVYDCLKPHVEKLSVLSLANKSIKIDF